MNYKIISQQDAHWQKFKELRLKALETDPSAFGASFDKESKKLDQWWIAELTRPETPHFFIEVGDIYVAMAGVKPVDEEVTVEMLVDIYVRKEYRVNGFAKVLLQTIERYLKNKGIHELDLIVSKNQHAAVKLYEKSGFVLVNETEEKMGDGIIYPCLFMTKKL